MIFINRCLSFIGLKVPPPYLSSSSSFKVITSPGQCHFVLFVCLAVNDGCVNVLPVTLNESIVLSGHGANFTSDNTYDLIILLSFSF